MTEDEFPDYIRRVAEAYIRHLGATGNRHGPAPPRYTIGKDQVNRWIIAGRIRPPRESDLSQSGFAQSIALEATLLVNRWGVDHFAGKADSAEGLDEPPEVGWKLLQEASAWTLDAIGVGIVGGFALEGVKLGWRQIRRLRNPPPPEMQGHELRVYIVKMSIIERCEDLAFPVPPIERLVIRGWQSGPESTVATVACENPEMEAFVEVPYTDLEQRGVRVSIQRPNSK